MFPHPAMTRLPLFRWAPTLAGEQEPPSQLALLECIMGLQPQRVVVVGEGALDILCALIRTGCESASEVLPSERPEPHSADLVAAVMPRLRGNLAHLLSQARRALAPGGWLVLQVSGEAAEARAWHGGLRLRDAGFSAIRTVRSGAGMILVGRLAAEQTSASTR